MSAVDAFLWGGLTSASLYIGQVLAGPLEKRTRVTGLIMGFGAGTMLCAIAYELIPETVFKGGGGIGFLIGALTYFVADWIVDRSGGEDRQEIDSTTAGGSGSAMFLGALLDGVPEAFVLGINLALGGAISLAFVVSIFVSNIPQGVAGTTSLKAAGNSNRRIFWMWTALTVTSAVVAALGFHVAGRTPFKGQEVQAFAAGAVLMMLANSMMPEAFQHGGKQVGLLTVFGFFVAGVITVLQ